MFTERTVREAKPTHKTEFLWDNQIKGFGLRITPKGVKSYILNYRVNGRERRATIGRASEFSLKKAREIAASWLADVKAGESDPLEVKRKARQEARQAPTMNDGLDYYFNDFAPAKIKDGLLRESTFRDYKQQANKYLRPKIGQLKIADVQRSDVERVVAPISGTIIKNRVLSLTSSLFSLFEEKGWRPQNSNPTSGISRSREEPRDRVLSADELAALSEALKQYEQQYPVSVAAIRVAAFTGLRISEVLGIQWEHIDFETGRLVLPDTKTGRRIANLPTPALAIVKELPRSSQWVFTGKSTKAAITYRTVRKHWIEISDSAGFKGIKRLDGVTLHDLRRTFISTAASSASGVGASVSVVQSLLGHKSLKVALRYVNTIGNEVVEARESTADRVQQMFDGKAED